MARWTGLEPATPGVTGRYSNRLSYHRAIRPPGSPDVGRDIKGRQRAVKAQSPEKMRRAQGFIDRKPAWG